MIIPAYTEELAKIKLRLSRYSQVSTFNAALKYLGHTPGKNSFEKMPWVVMFLLKQALLQKDGSAQMSEKDLLNIANRIYRLADKLIGRIPQETFLLMMRAILAQQHWYQINSMDSLRYLLLHRELLNRSYEVNNRLFLSRAGIELNDYYKIALYLIAVAAKEAPNSVIRYSMTSFYSHLSPALSDETLTRFLKLVALPFRQLPDYMKGFEVPDANAAELYQETPFKSKPIIVGSDGLIIFNAGLCVLGLRAIALEILKSDPNFTHRFGDDMENYIGERLRMTAADVYTIPELNTIIPIKVGKIADYVVSHEDQLLVFESKSIIPNVLMKCAFDPEHLAKLLRGNFIKGVEQGQETAYKLSRTEEFSSSRVRIIVVTLDDFYIYGGDYISNHLDPGFELSLISKYGKLPVPMSKVIYMTLKDLNILTEWLRGRPAGALFDFLDELERKQQKAGGMRFSLSQHIDEHIGAEVFGPVGAHDAAAQSEKEMNSLLQQNMAFRRSQHVVAFMDGFNQFKQRLAMAFM